MHEVSEEEVIEAGVDHEPQVSDREGSGDGEDVEEGEEVCYGEGLETKEILRFKKKYGIPRDVRLEKYQYEMIDQDIPLDGGRYTEERLLVSGNYEFDPKDPEEPLKRKSISSRSMVRIDNLTTDQDQLSAIFQEARLKRLRTKGVEVSIIGGEMSTKNKRAVDASLPMNNPSLTGYNTDTEIDAMFGEFLGKNKRKRKVNVEIPPLLNPKRTTRQSSSEGVEGTDKLVVMVSGLPPRDVLKKDMAECMVRIDSLDTFLGEAQSNLSNIKTVIGEAMGRVEGSGTSWKQTRRRRLHWLRQKKMLENEKKEELAVQKAEFEKEVADVRRSMELEQKKLLDEMKERMNEEKLQKCHEVKMHFKEQFDDAEERKKYYKGVVKAGGLPCDDSSDDDVPQTSDVRGGTEVVDNEMTMEGEGHLLEEVADVQVPEDASNSNGRILSDIRGDIELKNIHFSYPVRPDEQIFNGFSLSILSGTTVALVGESGSGKSTLKWLRDKIGLVSQEPVLFASTIKENIAYGKDGTTLEEIRAAAEFANASKFIDKLPQGLDTSVGEHGTQLSRGQKQRVAIARAILKDPQILLLDEATSALDAKSKLAVQEALDRIMVNRTTVIVAHLLSTVRNVSPSSIGDRLLTEIPILHK
ncbi:hypothetical protein GIB67_029839 [Kingdonia uniflora]|uniref:ABC transporter domain-containing protein n=1 Tax=Kingdonia uniflora TaxID=39325 RepID=A0A7J7NIX0_9MAGN|nr:hypothetical protein GIB67_029839 [Kingdonia uniflora]